MSSALSCTANTQKSENIQSQSLASQIFNLSLCSSSTTSLSNDMQKIREMSKNSIVKDFDALSRITSSPYRSYICIDTEFLRFIRSAPFGASAGQCYNDVKLNVDVMKLMQLGFTLYTKKLGITRPEGCKHHQAGHDSLLIGQVFWKIKKKFGVNKDCFAGVVHGAKLSNLAPIAAPPPMLLYLAPQAGYFGVDQLPSQGLFYYTSPIMLYIVAIGSE